MHLQSQNQAKLLTRLINLLGKNCPIHQVLREGVINGIEANNRDNPNTRGKVLVAKDWGDERKLSIINVNGEYLSEEKAKNHLITLAESGNTNGHTENFGIGAKVSYLPQASQGILYRSISEEGYSVKFQIMKRDDDLYGLKDFKDQDGSLTCFPELTDEEYESVFSNVSGDTKQIKETDYGTEMVLMGDSDSEDTWLNMNIAVARDKSSMERTQTASGKPIHFYLTERLWEDMGSDIYITEYSTNQSTGAAQNAVRQVYMLKDQMTSGFWELEGCIDLKGVGIPKGTKAYYCVTRNKAKRNSTKKGYGSVTGLREKRYFTSFAWRKENYVDFGEHPQTRIKKAKECGIYAHQNRFVIVFELPDNYDPGTTADRTKLIKVDENLFYTAFRENIPQDILDYLAQNTEDDLNIDISTYAQQALKDMIPKGTEKVKDGITKKSTTTTVRKKTPRKSRQKAPNGWSQLRTYKIPDICSVQDTTAPLIEFQVVNWRLVYNTEHPVWKFRAKRIEQQYLLKSATPTSQRHIEIVLAKGLVVNALRRIFETQQAYSDESRQIRESKWESSILEACWTLESEKMIERELRKLMKKKPVPTPSTNNTTVADDDEDTISLFNMIKSNKNAVVSKSLISL